MIKLISCSSSQNLYKKINKLNSYLSIKNFYKSFYKKFKKLNHKFRFTSSIDLKYVNKQLKNIGNRKYLFFGIPFGIKDVINTKNLNTEYGSAIFKNFLPGNNARVVDKILEKQGIVFCKTTTAEFAVHFFPEQKTLNPYNKEHITGTSSSGSAVSVSCGALPVSLATQTAGSIIRPASFCGVTGFKPSFGAIDRTGILKTTDTLDTVGLFANNISLLKEVFKNLLASSKEYPYSKNFFEKKTKKNINITIITEVFKPYNSYDNQVKKDFIFFCKNFLKNYKIINNKKFKFINNIHIHHNNIYCKSLAYYFENLKKKKNKFSKAMIDMINIGNKVKKKDFSRSLQVQQSLSKKFNLLMHDCDFLFTPSTASVAPKIGNVEKTDTCLIWTFLGAPAISLPIFYDEKTKLPFGLQIVAKRYEDFRLLDFSEKILMKVKNYKF